MLNGAGLFRWSTITFKRNPGAHWRVCPTYAQVKNFSQVRKWNNVFANIHKQSFPLHYGRRDAASTALATKAAFRLVLPEELNSATTSHLLGAASKAQFLTCTRKVEMYQHAQWLCLKIMTLQRNTWATINVVESSWNVTAHGDAREGKWRGTWRMEWEASTLHTTSERGASIITTADAHTSAASSRRTDAPADLNGLVRFAETRNLVYACVPSHFKRSLITSHLNSYILQNRTDWTTLLHEAE